MSENEKKKSNPGCAILLVLVVVGLLWFGANSLLKDAPASKEEVGLAYNEITNNMKASLMAYTQQVLEDYEPSANKSSNIKYSNFVRMDHRYKIEGRVSAMPFMLIMEWDYIEDKYFDIKELEINKVKFI